MLGRGASLPKLARPHMRMRMGMGGWVRRWVDESVCVVVVVVMVRGWGVGGGWVGVGQVSDYCRDHLLQRALEFIKGRRYACVHKAQAV